MILNEDSIEGAIRRSVAETFGDGAVSSVEVEFVDDDETIGDVINVRIIVNSAMDKRLVSKFGLKLRKVLSEETDSFPLVSFISKSEFDRRHR